MATSTAAVSFLDAAVKSGLLTRRQLDEVFGTDVPEAAADCAAALVKAELLTQYQAKQILAGKHQGFVLGTYKILRPLGRGGMGVVYLGEHTSLGRKVALKVLTAEQAKDKLSLERFRREARAAAALDHPNIVRVFDISQGNGVLFLVMEYVDGKTLEAFMRETGPMHYAQAAHYVAQAAAGLQHAHEKGFVHRDIKPANLMLSKEGSVKILDMGLARSFTDSKDDLTADLADGDLAGTVDFLSPEQAMNQPLDERSDIYSLGVTFYALVTGHPPFAGTTAQKLMQHQMKEPPSLTVKLRGRVPEGLSDVIAQMMAKRPSERFQSAADVIDALGPWLPAGATADRGLGLHGPAGGGTGLSGRRTGSQAAGRERLSTRQKWSAIGGLAACGVLLVVGLIAYLTSGDKPATWGQGASLSVSPAGASRLVLSTTAAVNEVAVSADGSRFAAVDWSGTLTYGTTADWRRLNGVVVQPDAKLNCCAGTPDGRHVLVGGKDVPVVVYNWETGERVREYPGHGETWAVAVSPSGKTVATCGSDGRVVLRDFATGDVIRWHEFEVRLVWSVAFSPDGTKVAACCGSGNPPQEANQVRVWDTATGRELHRFSGHSKDVRWVTFSPDNRTVASAGFDGTVRLWDLAKNDQVNAINAHGANYVERVFFVAKGKGLVTVGADGGNGAGAIRIWDASTGLAVHSWRGADARELLAVAVSPDGKDLLTGSKERTVRLWKLYN